MGEPKLRFQQLKRNSNAILKKKLYKSGTIWIIKSTLVFVGGLVLFSSSQLTVAKADAVNNALPISQSISNSDADGQSKNGTKSDNNITVSTNNTGAGEQDGSIGETKATGQTNSEDKSVTVEQPNVESNVHKQSDDISTNQVNTGVKSVLTNQDEAKKASTSENDVSQGDNGSANLASSQPTEKESDDSDINTSNSLGVKWSVDGNVWNIEGGKLNNITMDSKILSSTSGIDKGEITKVSINGNITANKHLSGLFSGLDNLTEIDGLDKIDTSSTTDLSYLFYNCGKLKSLNINSWKVDNVQNFNQMFSGDENLSSLNISNWNWENGISFEGMFFDDRGLKSLTLPDYVNSTQVKDRSQLNFQEMFNEAFLGTPSDSADSSVTPQLVSLDLKNLDMSGSKKVKSFMQNNNCMDRITLTGKNILYTTDDNSNIIRSNMSIYGNPLKGKRPVAWEAVASNDDNVKVGSIKTVKQLERMYSGNLDKNSQITWQWVYEVAPINFQIDYVAEDDPTKSFVTGNQQADPYREDDILPLNKYTLPDNVSFDGYFTGYSPEIIPTPTDAGGTIKVKVPKDKMTIEVIEKNTNGLIIGGKPHVIIADTGSKFDMSNIENGLKGLSNNRKIITYSKDVKSKINSQLSIKSFNGDFDSANIDDSVVDMINGVNKNPGNSVSSNAQAFVGTYIEANNSSPEISLMNSGKKFVITLVYSPEPGDAPVINNNGGSSSNSSNSSEANRTVEGIEGTLGTYNDRPEVQLYDDEGSQLTDRKLAPSSDWFTDETMTLNSDKYYRVATSEWAKADDVYIYYNHDSDVLVNTGSIASLVTADGKTVTDRALQANSRWYTDRYIYINNDKYYRVATNEFVSADKVQEY